EDDLRDAQAFDANRDLPGPYAEALALLGCTRLAAQGRWAEALPYARRALAAQDGLHLLSLSLPGWAAVEALARAGERQAALDYLHSFVQRAGETPRCMLAQHLMQAGLSGTAEALAHLAAADELARGMELLGEQWHIALQRQALYARAGDRAQAQ